MHGILAATASPTFSLMTDPFPLVHASRLLLRPLTHADAPRLYAIHSDPQVMRWFGSDALRQPEEAITLIDTFNARWCEPVPGVRWAIERRSDGLLLGTCGLGRWNRSWHSAVTGYELARDAWGNGYMAEALRAALGWGWARMELNRVEAQIHPANAASIRLVEKLGFVREGLLRQAGYWNGQYQDLVQFGLLRAERK
ncbi:GNAT family protein [Silvimonas sp. JCM 19000]